jgi:hypothetical protein
VQAKTDPAITIISCLTKDPLEVDYLQERVSAETNAFSSREARCCGIFLRKQERERMQLWTTQEVNAWQVLQTRGILYGERRFVDPYCLPAYEWLCGQMEKHLGPRPHEDAFPVWAWYQYDGERRKKPDLRSRGHLLPGSNGMFIEIELADSAVLLSDYDLWHFPLNYCYLAGGEESARFDAELAAVGLDYTQTKPLPDPLFHHRMAASWERIFDLNWVDEWMGMGVREQRRIQATFWALYSHQVRRSRPLLGR